ncbi:guanitoxin biosynthesis MATE family efflux transporter GntT [Allocoleopsis franciscana]|uniref:Putative efflux protein, MATE family n=1 Tax=Allocoleopsis franciscana PCC 7113 TaxID=1173027 RepID=K9WIE5_9CYAN|nr:guanitoxin biosynthesis MATE family efflux transporter GntT [Allocoleopsis franciscana]AFZ19302.1 putative efflux protein, MATE family [Allocoleopsis franciscana PCC 7113]
MLITTLDRYDFLPRFFRLASVNILSNLMVPLAGLISVAFLGHLGDIRHLAGVTLSTVLFNYIYRTFGFLRMSTTGMTAQAVGREDEQGVLITGLRNGILALGLGMMILILQYPLQEIGFALLSATSDVKASGQAYYDARIWAAPATLLNFVLIGWFLGREQSGKVLVLSAVGNAANILLDYLLIVRLGWESAGAGFATAMSQYLMLLIGIIFICREVRWKEIRGVAGQLFDLSALKEALALNRDIFIRTFAFLSTFSIFTNLSSAMGTMMLTENALLLQVVTLAIYFIDGLAFATESLAGIYRGKEDNEQLTSLVGISGGTGLVLGLSLALVFVLFPEPLFGLLTNHTEVIDSLDQYVSWLLPILGFGSIAFILDGYFLGLAEGPTIRSAALTATLLGFAPSAIAAWLFHSSHLLWLAMSLFMVARVITLGVQLPRTLKG